MCDKTSRPKIKEEHEDEHEKFYADASFIIKKSFFRFIKGYPRQKYSPSWPEAHQCVYPKANSYYVFHEDTNPFTRFPAKCESREYGNVRAHFEPSQEPHEIRDPYDETEARNKYLASEPTCFVVLGKPDLNTTKLATMIADSWNCVLISPLSLMQQEIQQNSEKGKFMADVLKTGECLGPEIIMNLIASRLNKRDVFHKGYVVEGLPLIPNETLDYSSYPNISTEKLDPENDENFMKIFNTSVPRTCDTANEEAIKHHDVSDNSKDISTSRDQKVENQACVVLENPRYADFISSQIEDIFATWPIKPSIIVYVMCPDADATIKRAHFRIDPTTGRTVDTSFAGMSRHIEMLFSHNKMQNNMNVSFELYQELTKEERVLDENQGKYLLKRPSDERSNVESQCAMYKRVALPTIEKWILLYNPQNIIRVDGRTPVSLMFQIFISRLRTLPVPRVILPRRFANHAALEFEGESPMIPVTGDEFEDKSNEEAFQDLRNRETVSPLFPWRLSSWNFLCPVELTKGRTVEGLAKHTVRFMNKVFFLSSNEAADLFIENPRTFISPLSPRPTCKIVVFGPDYSGKSDLCDELARVLRGTIINAKEIGKYSANVNSYIYSSDHAIVEAIQSVPREEIDIEIWRDGGYIVDGMYPNIDSWKTIVEDSEIIFEDAILLFDDDPYDYLISKWRKIRGIEKDGQFEESFEDLGDEEGEEEAQGLVEYIRHIQRFESDWEAIRERAMDTCRNLITCDVGKITDISKYVMDRIKDRYMDKARVMTDEEKERERDLAEYIGMTDDTENIEEEEEEEKEGERETAELPSKEDNRRFGDTNYYCPVALLRYNIFWRGKEEFSAIFMDKIYHLSSLTALEEFLRGPQKLGLPLKRPLSLIPPLRMSIVGPSGSGKSTLSDAISREYGLLHIDYFNCFTTYMGSRGMRPLSHRDVLVLSNELPDEVELPADLSDERYNSDSNTILTFIRSYWRDGSVLLPERMHDECLTRFFKGLYSEPGAVFDQFPSCPQDVETAIREYTVPEIIIELRCGRETVSDRVIPKLLASWEQNLEEKKRIEQLRYATQLEDYRRDRDIWVKRMLHEMIGQRYIGEEEDNAEHEYKDEDDILMEEYVLSDDTDLEEMEVRRFELEETWYRENPEPVLFTDWEDFETARRRIEQEFFSKYETDSQKIAAIRSLLENESIPYIVVDAEADVKNVLLRIMRILEPYVRRDISILEKIYTIDLETADTLLDCGYYLLSSFGRWCPVQLRQNNVPLQMFLPLESVQEIYPVIHRQFVYFFGGKDAQTAFLESPFEYLERDSCAPIIPFRLSIIGPPKSGKTTLAQRFANKYGVKVITRGAALRYIVKYFPWTEWAQLTESSLRAGRTVPTECVNRAVEMYSIDPNVISQGFVLDGFPLNRKEYEQLTFLGLQPMITLDLKANLAFCLDRLSRASDDRTIKPPTFSNSFLSHRYAVWEVEQGHFRTWLKSFTQNVIELDATKCMWYVWSQADRRVCSRYTIIRSYFRESDYDKIHSLKYMSVSPYEFRRRQSRFESYCPLCLYYENTMKTSGPPDHRGTIQFREHFYWICSQHINEFIQHPQKYLPPANNAYPPEDRPRILTETIDLEHSCWAKRLQVRGFCLVTYFDGLPSRKLVPGKIVTAVLYKDNLYLFCTEDCRDKFLAQPDKYANVQMKFLYTMPTIDVKSLPNVGFLEQTVSKLIIKAVNEISVDRPKLPGLSPSATAAVYIGVYLKARNTCCGLKETELYKTISRRMYSREMIIKVATRTMKKRINPFIHAPVYKDRANPTHRYTRQSSMLSRIYVPKSTSITFRRTSPTQILADPDDKKSTIIINTL